MDVQQFIVHTSGNVVIDAKNAEEAEERAWDEIHSHGAHEVTEVNAEALNPEKDRFQVRISNCGSNKANGSYGLMTDKSALRLVHRAVDSISRDMVGQYAPAFRYELALILLAGLNGDDINKQKLWDDRNELKQDLDERGYDEVLDEMWAVDDEGENQR